MHKQSTQVHKDRDARARILSQSNPPEIEQCFSSNEWFSSCTVPYNLNASFPCCGWEKNHVCCGMRQKEGAIHNSNPSVERDSRCCGKVTRMTRRLGRSSRWGHGGVGKGTFTTRPTRLGQGRPSSRDRTNGKASNASTSLPFGQSKVGNMQSTPAIPEVVDSSRPNDFCCLYQ